MHVAILISMLDRYRSTYRPFHNWSTNDCNAMTHWKNKTKVLDDLLVGTLFCLVAYTTAPFILFEINSFYLIYQLVQLF